MVETTVALSIWQEVVGSSLRAHISLGEFPTGERVLTPSVPLLVYCGC